MEKTPYQIVKDFFIATSPEEQEKIINEISEQLQESS